MSFPPMHELLAWSVILSACVEYVTASVLHRYSGPCQKTSVAVLLVLPDLSNHVRLTFASSGAGTAGITAAVSSLTKRTFIFM